MWLPLVLIKHYNRSIQCHKTSIIIGVFTKKLQNKQEVMFFSYLIKNIDKYIFINKIHIHFTFHLIPQCK